MFGTREGGWRLWAASGLSAVLLELPFPLAGPMPAWRAGVAWFGLVPLLAALLSWQAEEVKRPLRLGFGLGYLCGVMWYAGNCYWIYDTMALHGGLPPMAAGLMLLGYSLVLGSYFGVFGLGVVLVRKQSGSRQLALLSAPVLWAALELAAARITSVPWDQLGYSQVDNSLVNGLGPMVPPVLLDMLLAGEKAMGDSSGLSLSLGWSVERDSPPPSDHGEHEGHASWRSTPPTTLGAASKHPCAARLPMRVVGIPEC